MCENCSEEKMALVEEGFKCLDCREDTMLMYEYYMVPDALWTSAVPDKKGMLCIGCLENRIGRALTPADFPLDIRLNTLEAMFPKSDRLLNRLGYEAV